MKFFVLAVALVAAAPAAAEDVSRWRSFIDEASIRFGIPTRWIERVMRAESAGSTTIGGKPIRSRAGAMGLMQLMPETWTAMRSRLQLGVNPDDPHDNILAGTAYLRLMYDRFGYPGLFGAYSAGPARYAAYLSDRRGLPSETVAYLREVADAASPLPSAAPPSIFAVRYVPGPAPMRGAPFKPSMTTHPALFAIRKDIP